MSAITWTLFPMEPELKWESSLSFPCWAGGQGEDLVRNLLNCVTCLLKKSLIYSFMHLFNKYKVPIMFQALWWVLFINCSALCEGLRLLTLSNYFHHTLIHAPFFPLTILPLLSFSKSISFLSYSFSPDCLSLSGEFLLIL